MSCHIGLNLAHVWPEKASRLKKKKEKPIITCRPKCIRFDCLISFLRLYDFSDGWWYEMLIILTMHSTIHEYRYHDQTSLVYLHDTIKVSAHNLCY